MINTAGMNSIREEYPVHKAKISVLTVYTVSRYEDCASILKDPRVLRNRSVANGGGSRFPFPVPKSVKPLIESMIQADDPEHRRLRELVRRAFRPQAIKQIEERIASYTDELLDDLERQPEFEVQSSFALPIPVRMIGDMLGVKRDDMPRLRNTISTVTEGFGGLRMLRSLMVDLPSAVRFMRELIAEKRTNPGDDILTELINTEHDGDQLTEDELVAMAFLLVVGGYETTVHLITNGSSDPAAASGGTRAAARGAGTGGERNRRDPASPGSDSRHQTWIPLRGHHSAWRDHPPRQTDHAAAGGCQP